MYDKPNRADQASIWQRTEMLRGIVQTLDRNVTVLELRMSYGTEDVPRPAEKAVKESRSGLDGALEDIYDELTGLENRIVGINQRVGQRGEGPRGELVTPRPDRGAAAAIR